MVTDDAQAQLLKDMATVLKEIRSLKTRVTKLRTRVESLELHDFQQQLTVLNTNIGELARQSIDAERYIAEIDVETLTANFLEFLQSHTPVTTLVATPLWLAPARELTLTDNAATIQRIHISVIPKSEAMAFRQRLVEYCRAQQINYFRQS